MTKIIFALMSAALLPRAFAVTASIEYVDRHDAATLEAANAYTDQHGVNTNTVIDIIHKTVDGEARPLPKYLHALDFADSYPDAAAAYYRSRGDGKTDGGCSAVREGGYLYRNFDFPFDDRAEFIVKMSAGPNRFASVGVAQVGTNLTEAIVTSGKPSRYYKALPGATVDGINENGVVAEINVVDGDPQTSGWHTGGDIHPLGAVRWALDRGESAAQVASNLAERIAFPSGWAQNYHYMIADAEKTYIVENGTATDGDEYHEQDEPVTMTNFQLSKFPWDGMGMERFGLLLGGANITNVWYTNAYRRETNPPWVSDLADVLAYTNAIFDAWASHPKEYFRNKTTNGEPWWQTVHTTVYDITNRTMRIAVQETNDFYTFQVPTAGGVKPEAVREIVEPMITDATNDLHAVKYEKDSNGDYTAVTIGMRNPSYPVGQYSFVNGFVCAATSKYSHAEGAYSIAEGRYSHAEGYDSYADSECSHAEGRLTYTKGKYSHAEGYASRAYGDYSHAEGCKARTGNGTVGHNLAFAWQGVNTNTYYNSHGNGTFNINPVGGLDGFWIGEKTIRQHIHDEAPAPGNYAAVSNAAMNAVQMVDDAAQNLRYTITADDGHFYFSPISAIDPTED